MSMYTIRRKKLLEKIESESITIIFGSRDKYRNSDVKYNFRQNSNFLYLIGLNEPDAICIIEKGRENKYLTTIFSKESNHSNKIWEDNILGKDDIIDKYDADYALDIRNFEKILSNTLKNFKTVYFSSENKKYYEKYIKNQLKKEKLHLYDIININHLVHEQRLIKDASEISIIRKSSKISSIAHLEVLNKVKPGIMEYQLESVFLKSCMDMGAKEQAYNPIFASGANSCTLHYSKNNSILKKNELILIDAGCEYKNYASDITRTYPINGKFNAEQKVIYEIVLCAQKEAIKHCKIGKTWQDINLMVIKIISEGLNYFKVVKETSSSIIEKKIYKEFYMHSPGHWLGLDVHDVGEYKRNDEWIKFKSNMYLTIEPGIYIREDNSYVHNKWKNIGVRIEDDILIKEANDNEILSKLVPKDIKEIENVLK